MDNFSFTRCISCSRLGVSPADIRCISCTSIKNRHGVSPAHPRRWATKYAPSRLFTRARVCARLSFLYKDLRHSATPKNKNQQGAVAPWKREPLSADGRSQLSKATKRQSQKQSCPTSRRRGAGSSIRFCLFNNSPAPNRNLSKPPPSNKTLPI